MIVRAKRYITEVILVIRNYCGYQHFLPCDPDFGLLFENFNLANNFGIMSTGGNKPYDLDI